MAVFRVIKDKENPYVMINKYALYDKNLSYKAKGILSYCLSRPDDWEFYEEEISSHSTDGLASIKTGLKELREKGYIVRQRKRDELGKFKGYEYLIYEFPQFKEDSLSLTISPKCDYPTLDNPTTENPTLGKPLTENRMLLNKDNTNKINKLNNDLKLNKETTTNKSSSEESILQDVINYYCNKAFMLETSIKPTEIKSLIKVIDDNISMELIKQGIDLAFKNFKPSFKGDKIKSFKYCEAVIRGLHAKELVKKEGKKVGADRRSDGKNLRDQGIGL